VRVLAGSGARPDSTRYPRRRLPHRIRQSGRVIDVKE
jgi:hypothetical protein